ncbi:MAG: hypothetical protein RJB58_313 [Pseudomonadota bacterium]|jgi:hypothetical protein
MTRAQQRFATASAAILVQIGLVLLFAHSFAPGKPQQVAREMMLILRPILRPTTPPPSPPARMPRMIVPQASAMPPILNDKVIGIAPASPSALEGIGRALFGCAPQRYGQLTREEQLRCPPPGEGLARLPDADLLTPPRSHSRDAARWAEDRAAREFTPSCFMNAWGGGQSETGCMIGQAQAESKRAQQARIEHDFQRARRNAPPPPKPIWVGVPPKR